LTPEPATMNETSWILARRPLGQPRGQRPQTKGREVHPRVGRGRVPEDCPAISARPRCCDEAASRGSLTRNGFEPKQDFFLPKVRQARIIALAEGK